MIGRTICVSQKVKTEFGPLYVHAERAENGAVVSVALSQPGKFSDTTLGGALEEIIAALNRCIEEPLAGGGDGP